MPTYVYRCPDCGVEVEERRKMSQADAPLNCPLCTSLLERTITSFMFNSGRAAPPAETSTQPVARHGHGCPCCYPTPRRTR